MNDQQDQLIALRTGKKAAKRTGEYWTQEEVQLLVEHFHSGVGLSEMALQLERNEVAVFQQMAKMGLLAGQCRPRSRRKKAPAPAGCLCPVCGVADCQNCGKECTHAGAI